MGRVNKLVRSETILDVFIASPGDVIDERGILEDIIRDLNNEWSKSLNIRLEPVMWETSSYPDLGIDAQDVINKQIDSYDIFIGIMWKHFGTPTGRAGSGTEEEFDIAYQKYLENPDQIKIMLYFNNASHPINEIDVDQLKGVFDFKEKVKEKGVYYREYKSPEEFTQQVRLHLTRQIQKWNEKLDESREIVENNHSLNSKSEDLEEEGMLDLIEIGEENTKKLEKVMRHIESIGNDFQLEIAELTSKPQSMLSMREIKLVTDDMAKVVDKFASEMDKEFPKFSEACFKTVDSLSRATIIYNDFNIKKEELVSSLESVQSAKIGFNEGLTAINEVKEQMSSIPRISTNFNRAKKHTLSTLSKYTDELDNAILMMSELENNLQTIIKDFEN